MDDPLFQFREDFFSGGTDGECYGVSVGKGVVLAEHPQQAAADLAVRGQLDIYILITMEQDIFGGLLIPASRISW